MGRIPFSIVSPNDPFQPLAEENNAFVASAIAHRRSLQNGGSAIETPRPASSQTIALVRNITEIDLDFFGVVGLGDPLTLSSENEPEFLRRIAFEGELPAASHDGRFGIVLEPAPNMPGSPYSVNDQRIARAVVLGYTQARIEVASELHSFADVKPGAVDRLITRAAGGAKILWRAEPDDDDLAWAMICIGGGGGSASATFAMITAKTGTEPPFRYSAEGATMDEDGEWSGGGTEYDGIFNIEEQGSGGQWVNPLLVGDVVMLWPAPGGAAAWVCSRSHYRGTY